MLTSGETFYLPSLVSFGPLERRQLPNFKTNGPLLLSVSSGLPLGVHEAQGVSAAGVQHVLVQEDVRLGRVAMATEEAEAGPMQLPQQAEPVAHHGGVPAAHLEARPVEVDLQQQLTHRGQDALQDQVLQDLPLGALHVRLQHVHLSGATRESERERGGS